jgi:hypothetical protein
MNRFDKCGAWSEGYRACRGGSMCTPNKGREKRKQRGVRSEDFLSSLFPHLSSLQITSNIYKLRIYTQ